MFSKLITMLYLLIDGFLKVINYKKVTDFDLFIENFLKSNFSNKIK